MKPKTVVTNPEELDVLNDIIHDCPFDQDNITYDFDQSAINIRFEREAWERKETTGGFWFIRKCRVPILECTLRILHAKDYRIHERREGGPGTDDILNIVSYRPHQRQVWIETAFTNGIEVNVDEFEMFVIECDRVLRVERRLSFFRP